MDRVSILANAPSLSANIGAGDMCVDLWLNAGASNAAGAITAGANNNWIQGNIFYDRDRFANPRAWGMSLGAGRVAVGLTLSGGARTIVGTSDIRGAGWRHIRFQRNESSGEVWLYVNGSLEANETGPSGDLSCPSSGNTGWDGYLILGVEKHDFNLQQNPSYYGYMAELLLRTAIPSTGSTIVVPTQSFTSNIANGASLYHFNEGTGTTLNDSIGNSSGTLLVGGTANGPQWSGLSPFV